MAFVKDIVKKQIIALLNLSVRDVSTNIPTYSTALGDTSYSSEEIDRAILSATSEIIKAICETDGHSQRYLFMTTIAVTHANKLPDHLGSIGVPQITPYSGATYTLAGEVRSLSEIQSYRVNSLNRYSTVAHNAQSNNIHSKLAGFYAIDNDYFYFTGHSATSALANFVEADYTLLPDMHYHGATCLAIKNLRKDGDISDIFSAYAADGKEWLLFIRSNGQYQPSIKKTIGNRENGTK